MIPPSADIWPCRSASGRGEDATTRRQQQQQQHHVPENIIHHPDRGCLCGVRAPHLLGDVRDCVHETLRQPQRWQLYHALPGREPETTGQYCRSREGFLSHCLSSMVYTCNNVCKICLVRIQLSIYTAVRRNAEGGHTLIHREDKFDVNSKFERFVVLSLSSRLFLDLTYDRVWDITRHCPLIRSVKGAQSWSPGLIPQVVNSSTLHLFKTLFDVFSKETSVTHL